MEKTLKKLVDQARQAPASRACARHALACMDLTSLDGNDTDEKIIDLCARANGPAGRVAAVCVYGRFVPLACRKLAGTGVKVASVCNFPHGGADAHAAVTEARVLVASGADEVDVVLPYKRYMAGDEDRAVSFIEQIRSACGEKALLKVILETSQIQSLRMIESASRDVILAGADFIKTSTGKVPGGAQLDVAATMLSVIADMQPRVDRPLGFKPSGGIRTVAQAAGYLHLADSIMGQDWANPDTFRFGASSLLDDVLDMLGR
ncbi:MAG: deoxyribose-phosphate aldolase [Desulfovibrionaceae bacterium]|nr:deoxyribose-phosphate aldolase [Desulfovibrionaceae bacterium]